jgi:hypothetical protein
MKKIFYACLVLASLLVSAPAQAQTIANLNFETWATRNGVDAPTNWLTTDDDIAAQAGAPSGTFNFGTVTKSTDKHGGTYAAKLTTSTITIPGLGSGPAPGELILGAKTGIYTLGGISIGGQPLAARPTQMQCFYKLTGASATADSALALVYMTKTTNGVPSLIGLGQQYLVAAANYTALTVPISYSPTSSATPDSIHIVFSSGTATTTLGTTLFVDDITITGVNLATRADADVQAQFSVSPNPSTGGRFQLNAPEAPALASAPLTVSDMMGRTVMQQPALAVPSPTRELDLSTLSTGIYLLRLDTKQGMVVRQLTIK